VSWCTQQI